MELLNKHINKKFNGDKLQRHVDVFSHPGAPLLGTAEFKEVIHKSQIFFFFIFKMNANYHLYKNHNFKSLQYRDYSIRLEEIKGTMNVRENDTDFHVKYNYSINYNDFNEILYSEKNVEKLKNVLS